MTRLNNIIHKSLEKNDLKETYLSIQISLDGFSFCIYDTILEKYIAFTSYKINLDTNTPESLLKRIKDIFTENVLLQQKYKKVVVIHENELASIIPLKYFSETELSCYLKQSVKVLKNDFIAYDSLNNLESNVVYIPFVNINNFIFTEHGSFEFYHSTTLLIDSLILLEKKTNSPETVYINVNNESFDIIVFKAKQMQFYNSFKFNTAADFIYHILFAMEQLNIDPNKARTVLLGDIEKESELYTIAYQYIRNLYFFDEENPKLTTDFESLSKHSNFTQLNQF